MPVTVKGLSRHEVLQILKEQTDETSQAEFSTKHSVSPAYVSMALRRRVVPGKAILDALGLEKVELYRRKVTE